MGRRACLSVTPRTVSPPNTSRLFSTITQPTLWLMADQSPSDSGILLAKRTTIVSAHSEIRHHCPNSPFLLVGTKSDLRKDARALEKLKAKGASLVDLARAEEKGQELAAARVMECSAKTQVGLKDVFDEAIKVALAARAKPTKKKAACALL